MASPGSTIAVPGTVDALESEDGASIAVTGRDLTAPTRPGVYYLRERAERVGALVVNPEPRSRPAAPRPERSSCLAARTGKRGGEYGLD
ncbi:MAG: hypothetical protein U0163_06590 [Gemmatimonadaceae bacterium]